MFENRTGAVFAPLSPVDVFSHPELSPDEKQCHLYARRWFRAGRYVKQAVIRICADDCFRLFLNGARVCEGPVQGYPFAMNVCEADLLPHLRSGKNLLALDIFYDGRIDTRFVSGDGRMGFLFEVILDGKTVLRSDERVRCLYTGAPDAVSDGEILDLNRVPAHWNEADFNDTLWAIASCAAEHGYTFSPERIPAEQRESLEPASLSENLWEFSRETTGLISAEVRGQKGSSIRLILCDGSGREREFLILCDGLEHTVTAFREQKFCTVRAEIAGDAAVSKVVCLERHFAVLPGACELTIAQKEYADRFRSCREQLLPADDPDLSVCDTAAKALARGYLLGDCSGLRLLLQQWRASGFRSKMLLSCFPCSELREEASCSLTFPLFALQYYALTADREFLENCLVTTEDLLTFLSTYADDDGLLCGLPGETGCQCRTNALYLGALQARETMRSVLDLHMEKRADSLTAAFNAAFLTENGLYRNARDTDTADARSCIFPLLFRLIPADSAQAAKDTLNRILPGLSGAEELFALLAAPDASVLSQSLDCSSGAPAVAFLRKVLDLDALLETSRPWSPMVIDGAGDYALSFRAGKRTLRMEKKGELQTVTLLRSRE